MKMEEITMKDVRPASIDGLEDKMRNGIVTFAFLKKDGTIRKARGTLMAEHFSYIPKGPKAERPGLTTYFDMDKDSFRCFVNNSFLGYVDN